MKSIKLFAIALGMVVLMNPALADDSALAAAKANFASADANADKSLSMDEFTNFVNANADADFGKFKKIRKHNPYDRAFKKLDADENGQVSWAEFSASQNT